MLYLILAAILYTIAICGLFFIGYARPTGK